MVRHESWIMDHGTYPLHYIDHQNVDAYTHSLDGVHMCVEVGAYLQYVCGRNL